MSDHLPECPLLEPCDDDIPEHGYCSMQRGAFCIHCHQWCICDRLRACEQRIEANNIIIDTINQNNAYDKGYAAGLSAARDAVAATFGDHPCTRLSCTDDRCIGARKALDAIDALRNDSPDSGTRVQDDA